MTRTQRECFMGSTFGAVTHNVPPDQGAPPLRASVYRRLLGTSFRQRLKSPPETGSALSECGVCPNIAQVDDFEPDLFDFRKLRHDSAKISFGPLKRSFCEEGLHYSNQTFTLPQCEPNDLVLLVADSYELPLQYVRGPWVHKFFRRRHQVWEVPLEVDDRKAQGLSIHWMVEQ